MPFARLTRLTIAVVLATSASACTESALRAVGADPLASGTTGARVTGQFPDRKRTPRGATRQFTSADRARLTRELDAARLDNERAADNAGTASGDLAREAKIERRRKLRRIRASGV